MSIPRRYDFGIVLMFGAGVGLVVAAGVSVPVAVTVALVSMGAVGVLLWLSGERMTGGFRDNAR